MTDPFSTPVVVIAGGKGRRIGGNKASRLLGSETLLARSLKIAARYSASVAVSVSDNDALALGREIPVLADDDSSIGPIAGLKSALNHGVTNGAQHVMILSCDAPFLPDDLMGRLQGAIGDANAALAASVGQVHAACSLWRTDALAFLPDYLAQGRRSLIGFAKMVGFVSVEWEVAGFDPFFNINTAEDLNEAERISARIGPSS